MATNEPTYEFDVVNLRQKRITTFRRAVNAMERQIKKVLQEEESKKNRKIYLFSIGKTYTHKTAKAYFLDPFDKSTFTMKGICNRHRAHRKTKYGKDGMVVVAIITNDVAYKLGYVDTEQCALDIERKLQDRFYSEDDRLIHEDYHQGPRVQYPADGYPIYITYAFTEQSPQSRQSYYYEEASSVLSPSLSFFPSLPPSLSLPPFLPSSSSLFSSPTYPQEPQYLPPLQTRLYWPIRQQQQQFHQTYYNRDWDDEDLVFPPHRRPNKCYRYNPYR